MKRSQEPGHGIEHGGFRRPIEASVCVGSERITGDEAVASEAAGVIDMVVDRHRDARSVLQVFQHFDLETQIAGSRAGKAEGVLVVVDDQHQVIATALLNSRGFNDERGKGSRDLSQQRSWLQLTRRSRVRGADVHAVCCVELQQHPLPLILR